VDSPRCDLFTDIESASVSKISAIRDAIASGRPAKPYCLATQPICFGFAAGPAELVVGVLHQSNGSEGFVIPSYPELTVIHQTFTRRSSGRRMGSTPTRNTPRASGMLQTFGDRDRARALDRGRQLLKRATARGPPTFPGWEIQGPFPVLMSSTAREPSIWFSGFGQGLHGSSSRV